MSAQTLTGNALGPAAKPAALPFAGASHPFLRVFAFFLVAGSFYLIEHSWDAQARFTEMISARSPEELETSTMFETSSYRQLGGVALGIFGGLVFLFSARKERKPLGALGALIFLYLGWNLLSITWADDPSLTFRRYAMFFLLCLGAYGVQHHFSLRQLEFLTLLCPGFFLLLGITAEAYNGTLELNPFSATGYRFAGTLHPNTQAVYCALTLMAGFSLATTEKRGRLWYWLAVLVAAYFLVLTKSRTALLAVTVVIALHWIFQQGRALRFAAITGLVGAVIALAIAAPMLSKSLGTVVKLGRTDLAESTGTLTGRIPVWEQAWEYVEASPLLGYGYGGFWNEERTRDFIDRQQWPVPHAHNAYLDVLLEAGPLAMLVYFLILLIGIRKGYALWRETGNTGYVFLSFILLFCLLNGFLESIAIQRSLITFMCMLVLVTLAHRDAEAREAA